MRLDVAVPCVRVSLTVSVAAPAQWDSTTARTELGVTLMLARAR